MSRIRVLRIIARMNVGGPALQVTGLLRGMDADRYDHRLVTGYVEEGEADYLELRAPDLEVQRLAALSREVRIGADARALAALVREMRHFRPDIVHTHTAKAGLLGRVAARLTGIPVTVHTFHGHLLKGYFSPAVTAAVVRTERWLARGTDRLFAVGEQVRDELLAVGVGRPDQYVVMPPGVELAEPPTQAVARERLGLPVDLPVVAYVARLTAVKRPDRLLEVVRRVAEQVPGMVVAVAGEGPMADEMRMSARDLGDAVRFLGWRPDVETVYAASDLVLLTSDNEGMPVSLIEASMAGRPCVTTDVGSAAEVVLHGRTGLVASTEGPELAEAVVELLRDPARRKRYGAAARDHAIAQFSTARLVRDTEREYERLLQAREAR